MESKSSSYSVKKQVQESHGSFVCFSFAIRINVCSVALTAYSCNQRLGT